MARILKNNYVCKLLVILLLINGFFSTNSIKMVSAVTDGNLLINADFENENVLPWYKRTSSDGYVTVTSDVYGSGEKAAEVKSTSGSWTVTGAAQDVDFIQGKQYVFSVWAKSFSQNESQAFRIAVRTASFPWPQSGSLTLSNNAWSRLTWIYTATQTGKLPVYIGFAQYLAGDPKIFYLDDTYIGEIAPSSIEVAGGVSEILIPKDDVTYISPAFSATVLNQIGTTQGIVSQDVYWSLDEAYIGISIDSSSGVISVEKTALPGNITIKATADNIEGVRTVSLQIDVTEALNAVERAEENLTQELIDVAQALIDLLPEAAIKHELQTRLDAAQQLLDNTARPEAKNVKINGKSILGEILVGSYIYENEDNHEEFNSSFKWYRSNSAGNSFSQINGAVSKTYILKSDDVGRYIKFEVTPRSEKGLIGQVVQSDAFGKISEINKISSSSNTASGASSKTTIKVNQPIINIETKLDDNKLKTFTDIKKHWAKDDIELLASKGIVKGIDDSLFSPDSYLKRAELLALVIRALNIDAVQYEDSFNDVESNSWYADVIQAALKSNIAQGNQSLFRPEDLITREEATKIVVNAYHYKKGGDLSEDRKITELPFVDNENISSWALDYIHKSYELSMIVGNKEMQFKPKDYMSRAEAVVVIKRLLDSISK